MVLSTAWDRVNVQNSGRPSTPVRNLAPSPIRAFRGDPQPFGRQIGWSISFCAQTPRTSPFRAGYAQGRLLALVRPREPDRADSDHHPRPGPLIGELWNMRQAATAGALAQPPRLRRGSCSRTSAPSAHHRSTRAELPDLEDVDAEILRLRCSPTGYLLRL
jgi:hypothetical protein